MWAALHFNQVLVSLPFWVSLSHGSWQTPPFWECLRLMWTWTISIFEHIDEDSRRNLRLSQLVRIDQSPSSAFEKKGIRPPSAKWMDAVILWGLHMGVSKNKGTPKSSIFIGFSMINHPFWGKIPLFLETPTLRFTSCYIHCFVWFTKAPSCHPRLGSCREASTPRARGIARHGTGVELEIWVVM